MAATPLIGPVVIGLTPTTGVLPLGCRTINGIIKMLERPTAAVAATVLVDITDEDDVVVDEIGAVDVDISTESEDIFEEFSIVAIV